MVREWRLCRWGDLATLEYGKGLQDYQNGTGKYRVYGTNGPIGSHSIPLCNHSSVIVGRKGAYRGVHYSKEPFFVIDTAFYLQPITEFDSRWAYYGLLTQDINSMDSGSAIPSTSRESFYNLPVLVPPLPEQRAIAHILGALDDKIELNRRMNETLEAMAQALFKNWFVDFEPFREQGMEDSPLGPIPKGWTVGRVADVAEFAYGKALKEDARVPGPVPVYGSNGRIGWHDKALVKGPGVVVGRKGNPGVVTWAGSDFFPIDTTFYVVPKGSVHSMYYLFHVLSSLDLGSLGADSAVPGLNRNMAYIGEVVVPPAEIVNDFDRHNGVLFGRVAANEEESSTLAAIRDALLPKLLSGEIRAMDVEPIAGRCV